MSQFRIRSFAPGQLSQWLSCGWRLLRRRPLEALRPVAVFAVAVLALRLIPVIGDIAVLLLLPSVVASYTLHVHLIALTGNAPPRRSGGAAFYQVWGRELRQALFGAWSKHENIFPLILIGLVLVVLGLIVHLLFNQVGGQATVSPYGFFELPAMQMLRLVAAYIVAAVLWIVIAACVLWALPLFVLRDVVLLDAMAWSVRAFFSNALVLVLLLALLAVALVPAQLIKPWSPVAHVIAQWLSLTLLAAYFGFCHYCSFRLVFADSEKQPPRPAAPPPPAPSPRRAPPVRVPPRS